MVIQKLREFLEKLKEFLFTATFEEGEFVELERIDQNPLISPNRKNYWEAWQTFNPGVVSVDNEIHIIYRAMGTDGASRLGYAKSHNGFDIDERSNRPVYRHQESEGSFNIHSLVSGGGWGGAEDPRLVRVGDEDKVYMTYTAFDNGIQVALTSIKIEDLLNQNWEWESPSLISPPDGVNKNWVIFPEKINGKYAILHSINPEIQIEYRDDLDFSEDEYIESEFGGLEREEVWDKWVRGAGPPPVRTDEGWLLMYHAMSESQDHYKVGALLLDFEDPTNVLYHSDAPILKPEAPYEHNGHKPGVVYSSGAVVKDGDLIVYYGSSDSYVCAASAPLKEVVHSIKKSSV